MYCTILKLSKLIFVFYNVLYEFSHSLRRNKKYYKWKKIFVESCTTESVLCLMCKQSLILSIKN